jgi:hypothetical protein
MCLYSIFELRITLKNGVDFLSESFGRSVTAAAHLARMRGRAGNLYLVRMGETHRPYSRLHRALVNTNYSILARNQARRHRVYSENCLEHSLLQECMKRRNQASIRGLPIPLLALLASMTSAYSSLRVSWESNP